MPWATQDLMNKRTEFAMKALQTDNFRALCREYGVSPRVGYKWRDRLVTEGLGGMREKSRRPGRSPEKVEEAVICQLVRIKERHRSWGRRRSGRCTCASMGARRARAVANGSWSGVG